tara:strand:+ start:92614 stop:92955 length:342 start_codon:yes stop_codon:yes gene_type:complete
MIVVIPFLFSKRFAGIALWPFIVVKSKAYKEDAVFLNHERIHLRQQLELLVLPFYLWYGIEYLLRLLCLKNRYLAYRNISFELEAYNHEKDFNYLKTRKLWQFLGYLKKKNRP